LLFLLRIVAEGHRNILRIPTAIQHIFLIPLKPEVFHSIAFLSFGFQEISAWDSVFDPEIKKENSHPTFPNLTSEHLMSNKFQSEAAKRSNSVRLQKNKISGRDPLS
jgi:hypothetical protein